MFSVSAAVYPPMRSVGQINLFTGEGSKDLTKKICKLLTCHLKLPCTHAYKKIQYRVTACIVSEKLLQFVLNMKLLKEP